MIGRLTGILVEKAPGEILVEAGGVGYRISVPLTTYGRLPAAGVAVTLSVHTHVREDALALYGFDTRAERDLFEKVIGVPGIGPRLAMAVLSHLDPADLADAVRARDTARLTRVPGIGPKTAERLVLELGGILKGLPGAASGGARGDAEGGRRGDLISALANLGYRAAHVAPAVEEALALRGGDASFEFLLRETLRRLAAPVRESRSTGEAAGAHPVAPAPAESARVRRSR